ncbi:MAG TPA: SDR family NAD(P)-dependent oxidoreductase [Solirubrobacteraceae bacterium]
MSYTKLGYELRSRRWDQSELAPMDGKVALVTGATSGLGEAAAAGLARLGATVWLLARNRERGEDALARIAQRTGRDRLKVGICDLSEHRSVRGFAERFAAECPRLDVLVNNAGVLTHERKLSRDGIELTLATNVVGPFLLTKLLVGALQASAPARVVNVSSGGMYTQRLATDDLQSAHGRFRGAAAYARSKRVQVVLSELWAQRLADTGVVVNAMHPGWVDTPGLRDSLPGFRRLVGPLLRTPEQGADTIVWLAAAPRAATESGGFWFDRTRRPTHLLPWTSESETDRRRLWAGIERLSR